MEAKVEKTLQVAVFEERKVVSFRWLSETLQISSNYAKELVDSNTFFILTLRSNTYQ